MPKTIFFLVKIFSEEKYASDFMRGTLYSNRLSFFRKLEEDQESNRGDRFEGVVGWHQPDDIVLRINGHIIEGLAGPVALQLNKHNNLHLFCLFAGHSGNIDSISLKNIDELKTQVSIPDDCLKLGTHAVVVMNVTEFFHRVKNSAEKNNFALKGALIDYYNPDKLNGNIPEDSAIFKKRDEFQHQKEYRFSIDTGTIGDGPLLFDIGDISDITMKIPVEKLNSSLEFKLKTKS